MFISMGANMRLLFESDPKPIFLLRRNRVSIANEKLVRFLSSVPHKKLIGVGTYIGKFTKSNKFKLQITALDYLAHYGNHKMWLKQQSEGSFLYGNHVLKRQIAQMTEGAEAKSGVIVYSAFDFPIGFGLINKSTTDVRNSDGDAVAVLNLADCGLYVREEREIFGLAGTQELKEQFNN